MKKTQNPTHYDLALIGNGIAAQSFLWNLTNSEVSRSQNFSIAHIYSEKMAPACSLRSSATVSLNGIEEDVSPLGNDMREAFFMFDSLYKNHKPEGIAEVKRVVVATNEFDLKKITRRYRTLYPITNEKILKVHPGVEYNSYMITPDVFLNWLKEKSKVPTTEYQTFVKNIERFNDLYQLTFEDGSKVFAKKILFAMGAYSKLFEKMLAIEEELSHLEEKNTIKAGSYFERDVDLGETSFYLSIDNHNMLYRKNNSESKLIIGSATTMGAFEAADLGALAKIFNNMKATTKLDLGEMTDYKVVTGLRHKGPKRMLISEAIDTNKTLFRINGLYKNGYSLGFLASQKMVNLIFN